MPAVMSQEAIQTLEVLKEEFISAPIEVVFETILEEMGPLNQTPDGTALPMKIEAWPGGRWFRDLGNNTGHLWGHVQAIKRPALLEICGPLFMSLPAISNVQYRLTPEGAGTRLQFCHRASGWIAPELRDGINVKKGWGSLVARIQSKAEVKAKKETAK